MFERLNTNAEFVDAKLSNNWKSVCICSNDRAVIHRATKKRKIPQKLFAYGMSSWLYDYAIVVFIPLYCISFVHRFSFVIVVFCAVC